MAFQVEEISAGKRMVMLDVEGSAIASLERRVVEETRKTLRLPGFRMGKVPASIIRQRAGASLREDAAREALQIAASEAVASFENLLHVSEVDVTEPMTDDGGLKAQFMVEIKTEFEDVQYQALTAELESRELSDADVDERLESLRSDMATLAAVEDRKDVRDGDVLYVTLSAPNDAAQSLVQEGERRVEIGSGRISKDFEAALIGAQVGEAKNIHWDIKTDDDNVAEAIVTAEVSEIKVRVLAELDDDFALDTGKADTLAQLRDKLHEEIKAEQEKEDDENLRRQILRQLREQNPMEIPEGYVKSRAESALRLQLEQMLNRQIDPQMMKSIVSAMKDEEIEEYRVDYHEECILNAIAKKENLDANEDEIFDEAKKWLGQASDEQIKQWLKQAQAANFVKEQILRNKAFDMVKSATNISIK